ncbi:MAG: beta-lactamase family protein [Bacilli bacterium]|nr:beta-lactamase family protein [Bacilli bacterium]
MIDFDLNSYLNTHSPGYVIEIYNNNETAEYVYGNKALIPNKEKTTKDTLYDIASLTKVFTATITYIAYEEKLIDINSYVYDVDSNFKNLKKVKIIDLLSHNQNIWTKGYLGDAKNKNDFFKILYSAFVKSSVPTYVDAHYIILSIILEKIYNKSFEDICCEKIFKPLGMNKTTFDPNPEKCASNNYEQTSDRIVDYIYPGLVHDTKARMAKSFRMNLGHASIFTTGKDLMVFLKTFLNNALLKEETIKLMLQHRDTNKDNYKILKSISSGNDINEMYDNLLLNNNSIIIPKTYNNMGTRYKNVINKLNDIPNKASENSISFSGYTGPMFTIDFDNKIIVLIMCNVIHNSKMNRYERKEKTIEIMNMIFDNLIH